MYGVSYVSLDQVIIDGELHGWRERACIVFSGLRKILQGYDSMGYIPCDRGVMSLVTQGLEGGGGGKVACDTGGGKMCYM